jgi:hypothetical protein
MVLYLSYPRKLSGRTWGNGDSASVISPGAFFLSITSFFSLLNYDGPGVVFGFAAVCYFLCCRNKRGTRRE